MDPVFAAVLAVVGCTVVLYHLNFRAERRYRSAVLNVEGDAKRQAAAGTALGPAGSKATLAADDTPEGFLLTIAGPAGHSSILLSAEGRANLLRTLAGGTLPRPELGILRDELVVFVLSMERRLRAHDGGKGWPPVFRFGLAGLDRELRAHVDELEIASALGDRHAVLNAAADVANLAMLTDLCHERARLPLVLWTPEGVQ
jgi:hypothetical protein